MSASHETSDIRLLIADAMIPMVDIVLIFVVAVMIMYTQHMRGQKLEDDIPQSSVTEVLAECDYHVVLDVGDGVADVNTSHGLPSYVDDVLIALNGARVNEQDLDAIPAGETVVVEVGARVPYGEAIRLLDILARDERTVFDVRDPIGSSS